ncbi:TetR family transcriptional regulator [Promicromonospora citrea]|uniref:acyl-CoA-like ligand-binding transcription factor n=1 Tax=Promicromonospora citrea TaxID=43677 RepID=UPI00360AFACB
MERAGGGARARARQAMRAEVAAIVGDLVLEQGYERTTVDHICAAAGISRSTFFRYFPSKEDALLGGVADSGETLRDALAARPEDELPWVAVRRALQPLIDRYAADDERVRRLTRLMMTTPALLARHQEKNARWYELLRPEVARRLGADVDDRADPGPQALIGAALACVQATLTVWSANPSSGLSDILDRAMGVVGPVG